MARYLEINHAGVAFHEPDPLTMFTDARPPVEVIFCDCAGVGHSCHHRYANGHEFEVHGRAVSRMVPHAEKPDALVPEVSQDAWKAKHAGPRCQHRRQIFVDVTHRPDAQLGMKYDEASDTFSVVQPGK